MTNVRIIRAIEEESAEHDCVEGVSEMRGRVSAPREGSRAKEK
jgi:hypothetical protein